MLTAPLYPGATPLPELLTAVATELRTRATRIRNADDFRAVVLSAECDKLARFLTTTEG